MMTEADIVATIVKPWTVGEIYVVVPSSGHFMFFESESEAEAAAYRRDRGHYTYDAGLVDRYGERLTKAYDTWKAEEAAAYQSHIAASLDLGKIVALVELVSRCTNFAMAAKIHRSNRGWSTDDEDLFIADAASVLAALQPAKETQP